MSGDPGSIRIDTVEWVKPGPMDGRRLVRFTILKGDEVDTIVVSTTAARALLKDLEDSIRAIEG